MERGVIPTKLPSNPSIWVIRAGQGGAAHALFLTQRLIALGDAGLGDLRKLQRDRGAFYEAYSSLHPDAARPAIAGIAGKFYRFAYEVTIGDVIVYPSLVASLVHVGIVTGHYKFTKISNAEYPHQMSVNWKCAIPKDSLSESVRREMGAARTFFQIKRHASIFIAYSRGTNVSN
jgi:predicted Mrr-cat superfamily restriction endonuclease